MFTFSFAFYVFVAARQPTKKPEDVELLAVSADPEKPPSN